MTTKPRPPAEHSSDGQKTADGPEAAWGRELIPAAPRQTGVDRFDDAIVVTRPRAWIGLAACLVLIVGVIVWATTTRVDTTIGATGVALVNGAVVTAQSPADGTIVRLDVAVNDLVHSGQAVGTVATGSGQSVPLASPIEGQVIDVPGSLGAAVHQGEDVFDVTQTSGPLVVRTFLPPDQAQKVKPGATALMSFSQGGETVRGRVNDVGRFPLSEHQVSDDLSPGLAASVAPNGGVAIGVTPDPGSASRSLFENGDQASVTLIVGSQHPIDYVF